MRVLVELRPALDGFSGIPQETRLVFGGLAKLPGMQVEGLVQSGNLRVAPGLPLVDGRPVPVPDSHARRSRVIVSLMQNQALGRVEHQLRRLRFYGSAMGWAARAVGGIPVPLTGFDPEGFEDWIWRAMFAKTLPPDDLPAVTTRPLRLLATPWSVAHGIGRLGAAFGLSLYPTVQTEGADVLIAETPLPARVRRPTRLVVRYHDSIPVLMPHTIKHPGRHHASHQAALMCNARDGAWFACVSETTRRDLVRILPELEERAVTIPNMISHHFRPQADAPARVEEILWSRRNRDAPHGGGAPLPEAAQASGRLRYLLMVATIEPRKNHAALLEAWHRVRAAGHDDVQLVFVGGIGWDVDHLADQFAPWLERGGLHMLHGVPSDELRQLYRHAAVTVCPSFGEGFDFPGIEAMRSGGLVAASDIPVHRDVFADACAYFDPYDVDGMAKVLIGLLEGVDGPQVRTLRERGAEVGARYVPERVMPMWAEFLERVMRASPPDPSAATRR